MFCHKDSQWCKTRQAEKLGIPYADKPGLPVAVRDAIMPIFQELSKPELLEKGPHGKTQNCNEALNAFIWKRLPKDVFVGPYVLAMIVCSAIIDFNSGTNGILKLYEKPSMTRQFCSKKDSRASLKDGNKDVNRR